MSPAAAAACVFLAAAAPPSNAGAAADDGPERQKRAGALLDEGVTLFQGGDCQGALTRFSQAQRLYPSSAISLNLAVALAAPGYVTQVKTVQVAAGGAEPVPIVLEPVPPPAPAPQLMPPSLSAPPSPLPSPSPSSSPGPPSEEDLRQDGNAEMAAFITGVLFFLGANDPDRPAGARVRLTVRGGYPRLVFSWRY